MKKKIILHGHLAEKYPHDLVVEAETIAEAVRALEQIKEPGAAGLLRELSKDSDVRVSTKASQLLRELESNKADPRDEEPRVAQVTILHVSILSCYMISPFY